MTHECTTHHHACDCREAEHQYQIEKRDRELEAAKQRELELLAYSEELFTALWAMPDGERVADAIMELHNPSQALREHEAKVLEQATYELDDLFTAFGGEHSDTIAKCQNVLRRIAEERRKK